MGKATSPGDHTAGALKVGWVQAHMPVLRGIRDRFQRERTFQ